MCWSEVRVFQTPGDRRRLREGREFVARTPYPWTTSHQPAIERVGHQSSLGTPRVCRTSASPRDRLQAICDARKLAAS